MNWLDCTLEQNRQDMEDMLRALARLRRRAERVLG